MAAVHKVVLYLAGGDRTSNETYWSSFADFPTVVTKTQALIAVRQQVLATDGRVTGFRISSRDAAGDFVPLRNSRIFPSDAVGPSSYNAVTDPALVGTGAGVGALKVRLRTSLNYRSQNYQSMCPAVVVVAYTPNFAGLVSGSDASKVLSAWRQKWNNNWKPHLQDANNGWSMKVLDRTVQVPGPTNTIIAVQSAMLGTNEIIQVIVAGNQSSIYQVGKKAQIKGSRIFGSRRRPMDRTYWMGDVQVTGGNTVISMLCSDASLVDAKWCSYGWIFPVKYALDGINGVADTSELIGTGHRRGNRPFIAHRGSPVTRFLRA